MTQQNLRLIHHMNVAKVALVVITLIALISYPYIPKKTLNLYPGNGLWWGAYSDAVTGGNSKFEYPKASKAAIKCVIGDVGAYKLCGDNVVFADDTVVTYDRLVADLNFAVSNSPEITRDFSGYLGMWVEVDYRGPANFIYLSLQNHEPALDLVDASRQFRSQNVGISTSELNRPVYIRLEDFKVGDWWLKQFSLHRTNAGVRFDHIRAIGIEIKDEPPQSEHYLEIKSITFIGEWISKENFYFIIIIILAALLFIEGAARVYSLYIKQRLAQKSLQELREHNQKLQSAAYKDELTQLLNRRAIHEVVLKDLGVKRELAIAIIVIDIDHFKKVNDTYGHALGDKVLASVAQSLKNASRDYDQIARWGGEEFVIITRESLPENLFIYAEKLREMVASNAIVPENSSEPIYVNISIGITMTNIGETFEEAFDRADAALYYSKRNGRNRCTYS